MGEQKLEENPRLCPPETVTYLHKFWVCYPSVFNLKAVRKNARGKRRGSVENFLSNKFEVFLHFFFLHLFQGGYEKLAKTRLEKVTAETQFKVEIMRITWRKSFVLYFSSLFILFSRIKYAK